MNEDKAVTNVTITHLHDEQQLSTESGWWNILVPFTFPGSFPNYSEWEGPDNANLLLRYFIPSMCRIVNY